MSQATLNKKNSIGRITSVQPFSIHDGGGLRTVVFLKGCNLRCFWCHNPETQRIQTELQFFAHKCIGCGECVNCCPESDNGHTALFTDRCRQCCQCAKVCWNEALTVCGFDVDADTLVQKLSKDKRLFKESGGGVTFSGGEPLLQANFVAEVMAGLQENHIEAAIETAVCVPWEAVETVLPWCDLFICDIKSMDSEKHRKATGAGNERILENIQKIAHTGKELLIRTPVIPGFNDTKEDIWQICTFIKSLPGKVPYELLPFHGFCVGKYESLGRTYTAAALTEPDLTELRQVVQAML